MAVATNAARDLQNGPANEMTPDAARRARRELAAEHGTLTVETMGRAAIEAAGMGAFAAVASGSREEPQLITLRYAPADATGPVLGLVGKAVTFDSGGISIKSRAKMSDMKFDMSGGAAVLEAVGAIARLGLPVPVVAVIGATENLPDGARVQAGRHPARQERDHDRGHQHRRRGPAGPGGLPDPRDRAGRRAPGRRRHPHRGDHLRASAAPTRGCSGPTTRGARP